MADGFAPKRYEHNSQLLGRGLSSRPSGRPVIEPVSEVSAGVTALTIFMMSIFFYGSDVWVTVAASATVVQ